MKRNNSLKVGIVVLVLLLAVGFAAVTTTLIINGTINIGANQEDFQTNVIFVEASAEGAADANVTGDAAAAAQISTDGKTITFTTQILDSIGETATLKYKVKNNSQYDAKINSMTCNRTDSGAVNMNEYVTITNSTTGFVDSVIAKGGTSAEQTVEVKMIKSYANTGNTGDKVTFTFTCTINATAQEAA